MNTVLALQDLSDGRDDTQQLSSLISLNCC